MKPIKNICPYCEKKFIQTYPNQKYCNKECQNKHYLEKNRRRINIKKRIYYENNKNKFIEKSRKWAEDHPRKAKQTRKKAMDKFRTEKREHFNKLVNKSIHKNYDKHLARMRVYRTVRAPCGYGGQKVKMNKVCHICNSRYKVWLFYDVYPLTPKNILKALKTNKVRYLCRRHWKEASKKRKLRYEEEQKSKMLLLNSG